MPRLAGPPASGKPVLPAHLLAPSGPAQASARLHMCTLPPLLRPLFINRKSTGEAELSHLQGKSRKSICLVRLEASGGVSPLFVPQLPLDGGH